MSSLNYRSERFITKSRKNRPLPCEGSLRTAQCVNCNIWSGCPGTKCGVCELCCFQCDCSIPKEVLNQCRREVKESLEIIKTFPRILTQQEEALDCQCACLEPCYCTYLAKVPAFPRLENPMKDTVFFREMTQLINNFTVGDYQSGTYYNRGKSVHHFNVVEFSISSFIDMFPIE